MERVDEYPHEKSDATRQPWNTAHLSICLQKTLRNDAVRDQKRVLAEARDVERVAETMRVNDERVVLRRESW